MVEVQANLRMLLTECTASFRTNVVEQKTPKNVKWLSPTGETTWVVSQGGGRFLLVATNQIPKLQVWPGVDNDRSLKRIMRSSGPYLQQGLYTTTSANFHGFVEVS